jgi:hypothetical protein
MTALVLQVTPFVEMAAPQLQAVYMRFLRAFDGFAQARMPNAVPEWQLRRAQRELDRCRRLMRAKNKLPVKTARTGR